MCGSHTNAQKCSIAFDNTGHLYICIADPEKLLSVCMHYCPQHGSPSSPVKLPTTAHPPGPPRNLTFNFYLDFETNKFRGNATWIGPEMPEGKLIEYRYVLSSVVASISGGTISVTVCVNTFV